WAGAGSFNLTASALPAIVKQLPASNAALNSATVQFRWADNSNAHSFQLYISGPSGFTYNQSYSDSYCASDVCEVYVDVPANGSYTWYVRGMNAAGGGTWGTGSAFTVTAPAPGLISKVSPTSTLSSGDVVFTWNSDANAVDYRLYITGPSSFVYN